MSSLATPRILPRIPRVRRTDVETRQSGVSFALISISHLSPIAPFDWPNEVGVHEAGIVAELRLC